MLKIRLPWVHKEHTMSLLANFVKTKSILLKYFYFSFPEVDFSAFFFFLIKNFI